jgi:hypothetical protein
LDEISQVWLVVGKSGALPRYHLPHTPFALLGYGSPPISELRRAGISNTHTPPGRLSSLEPVTVSTKSRIASAAVAAACTLLRMAGVDRDAHGDGIERADFVHSLRIYDDLPSGIIRRRTAVAGVAALRNVPDT